MKNLSTILASLVLILLAIVLSAHNLTLEGPISCRMRSVALREVYLSKWGVFKSCRPIFFSCQIEMKLLQESTGKMRELERLGLALDKKGTMFVHVHVL